ncbi:unnamed protein product [Urochloa humidicola]
MASGSRGRGRGSRASGGAPALPPTPAAAPAPALVAVTNPQLVNLPATDLVARLIGCNRRASDFVDVALILAARERRFAEAEARARAAEEDAARLRREIAAEAQIRRLVVDTELGLRAEVRAWQRRAAVAEARLRLQAHAGGVADLLTGEEEGKAQAEEEGCPEEAPLQVVSGKRKEAVASSPDKRLKKLIKLRAEGGSSSNAVLEPEAHAIEEAEAKAEDSLEDRDALAIAIIPIGRDVHDGLEMGINDKQGVGESDDQPEEKTGGEEGFELEPQMNPVALPVVALVNDLPLNDDGTDNEARDLKAAGGQENETELVRTAAAYAQRSGDNDSGDDESLENGVLEMEGPHAAGATRSGASRGLPKETPLEKGGDLQDGVQSPQGEREADDSCQCLAAQPEVLPLRASAERVGIYVEEHPDDDDKDAPQQ